MTRRGRSDDTPAICREAIAAKRHWLDTGDASRLDAMRVEVAASFETERSQWRDSGIRAIAVEAVLEALAADAEVAARGAATLARKLASQRAFARSRGTHARERGDDADRAASFEHRWQERALQALRDRAEG